MSSSRQSTYFEPGTAAAKPSRMLCSFWLQLVAGPATTTRALCCGTCTQPCLGCRQCLSGVLPPPAAACISLTEHQRAKPPSLRGTVQPAQTAHETNERHASSCLNQQDCAPKTRCYPLVGAEECPQRRWQHSGAACLRSSMQRSADALLQTPQQAKRSAGASMGSASPPRTQSLWYWAHSCRTLVDLRADSIQRLGQSSQCNTVDF